MCGCLGDVERTNLHESGPFVEHLPAMSVDAGEDVRASLPWDCDPHRWSFRAGVGRAFRSGYRFSPYSSCLVGWWRRIA